MEASISKACRHGLQATQAELETTCIKIEEARNDWPFSWPHLDHPDDCSFHLRMTNAYRSREATVKLTRFRTWSRRTLVEDPEESAGT